MGRDIRTSGSLTEQAYSRILDGILRGKHPLGSPLSCRKLALEYGMSFLPVSQAMNRLEREGLVESRPRVGTRVRIPSAQDVRDRHIIREALEAQSARLFAEKASADERVEMRAMAAHLDVLTDRCATGGQDPAALYERQIYHHSFHMRVAECTGCAALAEMLAQNQLLIFNWLYDVATDSRVPPHWHAQLAEQLTGADPDAAEAAMRAHVRNGIEETQAEIVRRFGAPVNGRKGIQGMKALDPAGTWRTRTVASR